MKKGVKLLISIVERGQGKVLTQFYSRLGLNCHFQTVGHGTASSDLLDILGLGSSERDVLITFGENERMQRLFAELQEEEEPVVRAKGLAFSMPLTAMNTLAAATLMRETEQNKQKGAEAMQQKENVEITQADHSVIFIVVNQGHTDEVMNTARAAGARGGTIIRSRWAGSEEAETFYGITLQAEKEVIAIVAGAERRKQIMESVNKKHGMNTKAGALICSVAIDHMQRLG